jgi:hypothetical protein
MVIYAEFPAARVSREALDECDAAHAFQQVEVENTPQRIVDALARLAERLPFLAAGPCR